MALSIAGLKETADFGGGHLFLSLLRWILGMRERKIIVLQFLLYVEFVELIVDGIIRFLRD